MKVLHVVPGISAHFGGPSKAAIEMCCELRRHGLEVEIATTDADVQGNITIPLGRPVGIDGVMVWCFESPLLRKYGFSPGLTRWLKQHATEYHVLHIHGFFSYIPLVTTYHGKKKGIPYIVRPIGHLNPWCFERNAWRKRPFYWLFGRWVLHGAAAIHVTSEMEHQGLAQLGFGEKSVVIPLGVELSSNNPPASRYEAPQHIPRILFLSRIDPKKGLPVLIKAIGLLRDRGIEVALTVAGSGEPSYLAELKDLILDLSIEEKVHFSGFVTGEEKERCLAESDIFVLPSYDENFGIAVAEAMAAGLPVIISDAVALAKEVAEAGAGIVVPAGSVDKLAKAIAQVVSDPDLQRDMARRARTLVEQRFTWPKVVEQLIDLYRAVSRAGRTSSRKDALS